MTMIFGMQFGGAAIPQRDALAAAGKLGTVRFPACPDTAGTGFSQGWTIGLITYCQQHNIRPHITLGDAGRNYPADFSAFAESLFNLVYSMGVSDATFEVGNEFDQPSWIHPSTDMTGDSIFNAYTTLYQQCSDALKRFRSAHPYAKETYKLGGSSAGTGSWFTQRLIIWAMEHDAIMDYASWHHYGHAKTNTRLQAEIASIKAIKPLPVFITETSFDPYFKTNSTKDAVDWVTQYFPQPNVDTLIWLSNSMGDGAGIWNSDGTPTMMGAFILSKL